MSQVACWESCDHLPRDKSNIVYCIYIIVSVSICLSTYWLLPSDLSAGSNPHSCKTLSWPSVPFWLLLSIISFPAMFFKTILSFILPPLSFLTHLIEMWHQPAPISVFRTLLLNSQMALVKSHDLLFLLQNCLIFHIVPPCSSSRVLLPSPSPDLFSSALTLTLSALLYFSCFLAGFYHLYADDCTCQSHPRPLGGAAISTGTLHKHLDTQHV